MKKAEQTLHQDRNQELESELGLLLRNSLQGGQIAYAEFLERTAKVLTGYLKNSVRSSGGHSQQIEDLVQDILLAIHQKKHTYRTDLPVLPWLFTIARYRLIDSYRAKGRQPIAVSFEEIQNFESFEESWAVPLPEVGPDLDALLAHLPEKQRQVIQLAKIEELPLAEIAIRMNMSLSAVKVTVHRAVLALKREHNPGSEDHYEDS